MQESDHTAKVYPKSNVLLHKSASRLLQVSSDGFGQHSHQGTCGVPLHVQNPLFSIHTCLFVQEFLIRKASLLVE